MEEKKYFESIEEALYRVNGTLMNANKESMKVRDELKEIKHILKELLQPE